MMKTVIFSVVPKLSSEQVNFFKTHFKALEKYGINCFVWSSFVYEELGDKLIRFETGKSRWNLIKNFRIFFNPKYFKWLVRLKYWQNIKNYFELLLTHEEFYRHGQIVLNKYRPAILFVWNPGCYQFSFIGDTFKSQGVKISYIEWGAVPGTFILTKRKSIYFSQKFKDEILKLNNDASETIILFLKGIFQNAASLNLYEQKKTIPFLSDSDFWNNGKLKLLILGLSEADSLTIPNEHSDRKIYVPFFKNSYQAAEEIATKFPSIDVVFKPHPNLNYYKEGKVRDNLIIVFGDPDLVIQKADCVLAFGTKLEINVILQHKVLLLAGSGLLFNSNCGKSFNTKIDFFQFLMNVVKLDINSNQDEDEMILSLSILYQQEYFPFVGHYPLFEQNSKRIYNLIVSI